MPAVPLAGPQDGGAQAPVGAEFVQRRVSLPADGGDPSGGRAHNDNGAAHGEFYIDFCEHGGGGCGRGGWRRRGGRGLLPADGHGPAGGREFGFAPVSRGAGLRGALQPDGRGVAEGRAPDFRASPLRYSGGHAAGG